jgi:hypothetical protein
MSITDSKTNCQSDYITCGKIDSMGNRLCLEKNQECPKTFNDIKNQINSISKDFKFSNYGDNDKILDVIKKSTFFINTYDKSDVENNIMVETFVRNNPLCYSYSTKSFNRINPKSYFNQEFEYQCSTLWSQPNHLQNFDKRAKLIDWYEMDLVFKENKIYSNLQILGPEKNFKEELETLAHNKTALLFYNNYPGLNISCITNFNNNNKININSNYNKDRFPFEKDDLLIIQNVQAFLFFEFLAIMFNGVFIVIEIILFKDNWLRAAENKDELVELKYILTNYTYVKLTVAVGYFFTVFCTTLVSSIYYYQIDDAIYAITAIFSDKECVDEFTYELLNQTCLQLVEKRDKYSFPLCFSILYLIVYFSTILLSVKTLKKFEYCEELLREEKKKENNGYGIKDNDNLNDINQNFSINQINNNDEKNRLNNENSNSNRI